MNLYSTVFININLNEHFFWGGGRGYFSFSSDSISFTKNNHLPWISSLSPAPLAIFSFSYLLPLKLKIDILGNKQAFI